MSRRRQKWAEQRAQGFGPALQRNLVDADNPQGAVEPAAIPISLLERAVELAEAAPKIESYTSTRDVIDGIWGEPCPKCGRALKRQGRHLHIRACEGSAT